MCSVMKNQVAKAVFISLLLVSGLNQADAKEEEYCTWETLGMAVGGVAAVAAAPVLLGAAGFTTGGIAAGSLAAKAMSVASTTGVGAGVVGTLQSVGAAGLGAAGTAVVGGIGSAFGWMAGSTQCDRSEGEPCH